MLSKENIEKLKFNAYYEIKADVKYRGSLHANNLYHCCNWVFKVMEFNGKYFMKDTYWGDFSNSVVIEITNKNIDDFKFLEYVDNLIKIEKWEWDNYKDEDKLYLATDSGGWTYAKHYKLKNSKPDVELILENIDREIRDTEWKLDSLNRKRQEVLDGTHYLLR